MMGSAVGGAGIGIGWQAARATPKVSGNKTTKFRIRRRSVRFMLNFRSELQATVPRGAFSSAKSIVRTPFGLSIRLLADALVQIRQQYRLPHPQLGDMGAISTEVL